MTSKGPTLREILAALQALSKEQPAEADRRAQHHKEPLCDPRSRLRFAGDLEERSTPCKHFEMIISMPTAVSS